MPIIIPKDLPAANILQQENIFIMNSLRAISQDIRPIEIAIVNLMPTKIETETQLMRLLGNTPLQVNITLIKTASYTGKNVPLEHLEKFYKTFDDIKSCKFDGMIITGAPVETLEFNDVFYWDELKAIMDYAEKNVTSTIYICWGAQAALNYHYGIRKYNLDKKMFGVFPNYKLNEFDPLLKGTNDIFYIPQSRHTAIDENDVLLNMDKLEIIARSNISGISILKSKDNKKFFFTGHSEYDRETLKKEYLRDINKGLQIEKPYNYFINDNLDVKMTWCTTANLIFYNWLNHYVYQVTPFDISN